MVCNEWDDPIINGGTDNNLTYAYCCINRQEMQLTHNFSSNQFIPVFYGTVYDYYRYTGQFLHYYTFDAVRSVAAKQLKYENKFSVKFGSQEQLNCAVRDLIHNQKVYQIPGILNQISYSVSKSGLILDVTRK